jgi:putative PIG3 family NAD(P)H quinone oxidoreductase
VRAILPAPGRLEAPVRVGDLPDPVPGPGEVLVEIEAAGVNHADALQMRGMYPPPPGESEVPGLECSGRIVASESPAAWPSGSRVMALVGGGGHASLAVIPVGQLMALPDELSWVEGGAIPEAGLTAWTNLVAEGNLRPQESVLVTGATGGMGSFAVQLARELGARVLAAGRDRDRLEQLRSLGVQEICIEGSDLTQQVREATGGRGVDLVFDLVGGAAINAHLGALRDGGRLVLIGLVGGRGAEVNLGLVLSRRLHVIGSVLRPRSRAEKTRLVSDFAAFAHARLRDGRLRPVVDRVFPLERAAEAYRTLEGGGVVGKIVLSMA